MRKFYLFLLLIGVWASSFAQNTFEKLIDNPTTEGIEIVASCMNSNNEILAITLPSKIVKISLQGDTIWHKSLETDNFFQRTCISVGADNGIIVGGHSNQEIYIKKLNDNGDIDWEKSIGTTGPDYCYDIKAIANEGYILVGRLNDSDAVLMKLDLNGEEIWRKTNLKLDNPDFDQYIYPRSIQIANDGFVIGGDCHFGVQKSFLMKRDFDGNPVWNLELGDTDIQVLKNISLCFNGDILFAGSKHYSEYNNYHESIWYGKVSASGNSIWQNELKESNSNCAYDIIEDTDQNIILAGSVYIPNRGEGSYLAKFNSSGEIIWEKFYGSGSNGKLLNCYLKGDHIYGIGSEYFNSSWISSSNGNQIYMLKADIEGNVNDIHLEVNSDALCEYNAVTVRTLGFMSSYTWTTPEVSSNDSYVYGTGKAGDYSVSVVDRNGNTRQSNTVTIYPKPSPVISFSGETTFCKGGEITLSTSQEYQSYEWFRTDTLENGSLQLTSVGTTRDYIANQTADFQVQVTDEHGCKNNVSPWEGSGKERVTVIDPKVQIQSLTKRPINVVFGQGEEMNEEKSITQPAPWGSYKKSSHQQYLIRANELQAMGVEPNSELKELAFYLEKGNNLSANVNGFQIRMAQTTRNELTSLSSTESFRDVNNEGWLHEYLDAEGRVTSGWKSFNISSYDYSTNRSNGFVWDGESNVIVDVAFFNDQQTTYSNLNSIFRLTEMGYNASFVRFATEDLRYVYSGGTASSLRPNMRFRVELPSGEDVIVGCGTELALKLDKTFFEVEWSTGSTEDQITVLDAGTISVTTTDDYGCVATDTKEIKFSPVDFSLSKTGKLSDGEVSLVADAGFPYYSWSTGETTSTIKVNQKGTYGVTVTNSDGCSSSKNVLVSSRLYVATDGDDTNAGTQLAPYQTIQHAINTAIPGDTIIVKDGTYKENIDFNKNVVLGSEFLLDDNLEHIANTTIDGQEAGIVVKVSTGLAYGLEHPSGLIGFTIVNGKSTSYSENEMGGGINLYYWSGSKFELKDLIIKNNVARRGAGISIYSSYCSLENLTIESNKANEEGGGIYLENNSSDIKLVNVTLKNNEGYTAFRIGTHKSINLSNLQLIGNQGNGMYIYAYDNSVVSLENPLIVKSSNYGVYLYQGNLTINNGTIANNGTGIHYGYEENQVNLLNSIVSGNRYYQVGHDWSDSYTHKLTVNYSALEKGKDGILSNEGGGNYGMETVWGEGNLEAAIQFVDTTKNDYHLLPTSPAIGAGSNEVVVDGVTYSAPQADLYGQARPNPVDSKPDMGAIEHEKGQGDLFIAVNECGGNISLEAFNKELADVSWIGPDGFTSTERNLFDVKDGRYYVTVTDVEGTELKDSVVVENPMKYVLDIKPVCVAVSETSGRLDVQIRGGDSRINEYESYYQLKLTGVDYSNQESAYAYQENGGEFKARVYFSELKAGKYTLKISDNRCTLEEEIEVLSKDGRMLFVSTEGDDENLGSEELPLASIQTAINRACDLDTIIVEPGTYIENIKYNGKNVTLASRYLLEKDETYISQTIIDGNEDGSVVTFGNRENSENRETRDAKLVGFTIQNGRVEMSNYYYGGGISIAYSEPTLDHLVVKNNRARRGGGLNLFNGAPSITNVLFENNSATDQGSAISVEEVQPSVILENLTFRGNQNSWCCAYIVQNNTYEINIGNWTFENNQGSALEIQGAWDGTSQLTFNNFKLRNSTSGIQISQGTVLFNNLVASGVENEVISLNNNGSAGLINSTLVNNGLTARFYWGDSKMMVMNSILRNNLNKEFIIEGQQDVSKSLVITHSNVKGGERAIEGENGTLYEMTFDESNFDRQEYFVDAENGDFRLLDISPSVGAGISSVNVFDTDYKMPSKDFNGKTRAIPAGSPVDLGAFENESISRKIIRPISCNGGTDGSITISMLTGKEPFSYQWDDAAGTKTAKLMATEADRMYHVSVTDADGKVFRDSAWVTQPEELVAFVADSTNISRQGLADGDATIGVRGGNAPYIFHWEEIDKTGDYVNNLEANKVYHVTVIDAKGCQAHTSVVLKVLPLLENNLCGFASEDGEIKLNNTNITSIETDFEGTIWFATGQELTSYNGKDWDIINANFSYQSIHKDKNGNIWLGAGWDNKGLNMFDGRSWFAYKETDGLVGNNVYGITEDSYGNLWIATDKGVSRFDGETFANFTQKDGLLENYATTIFADKDGYIWVGSNSGISRYKTLSKNQGEEWENFQYQNEVSLGGVGHIAQDKDGNIWLSSSWISEGQSALVKFDGTNWSRVETGLDAEVNFVTDLYCDTEGGVWVGTSEGLAHFDGSEWHAYKKDVELPSNYVSAIGEDAYGAIWVGFSNGDNGISKYFNGKWTTLYKSNGASNNSIQAMALDDQNNLWVGTSDWENSLRRFDGNTWKIFNWEDGYQGYVYDLDTDSELKVWVGTDQGLYKYNGETFDKYDVANGLQSSFISGITIDANDNVWIRYEGEMGLDRFTQNQITNFTTDDGLLENNVREVQADAKGNIWISYYGNFSSVLSRYDGQTFTTFAPGEDQYEGVPSIEKLFVDSKDRVWAASQHRLAVLENDTWTYHSLEELGADYNYYINSIGEDADGNIWVTCYNNMESEYGSANLIRFDGANWTLFNEEDGIRNSYVTSIQDDNKGHIWFGSNRGLIRYTKCTNEDVIVTVNNGGCSGEEDRTLTVTPTGENAPYTFSIDNGASFQEENIFDGLKAGSYHLIVKNKNGELVSDREVMITEPVPLHANVEGFNATCNDRQDGAAVCLPTGGTGPYTFIWNDSKATTTARVEALSEGVEYTVTVTDANNCTATGTVQVGHDPHLKFTDWSNVSCYGLTDGMAVITPIGGKAPFQFQWDDINNTTDSIVTSLSGGKYHYVQVTDANNCVAVDSIKLEQPGEFIATAVPFNSCDGENTGGIELSISGGTIPYTYQWDDANQSTEGNLYKVGAGEYNVTVRDASGCESQASASIEQFDDSQKVEIVSNKEQYFCPGATELVATEGFTSYIWSNGETGASIVPELPGKHYVRVYDENGCSATDTIEIRSLRTYQDQNLCIVSVTPDNKNEVVWERRQGLGIVSYNVYKESNAASQYELIANVPFEENSVLLDEESDPASRSHTYAISVIDVCGMESQFSQTHRTMLLQANVGLNGVVNLDWNQYLGLDFETYNIYRGIDKENMELLVSISNSESKYIDNNPLVGENQYYVLEIESAYTCEPNNLKSSYRDYGVSRSNIINTGSKTTGIQDIGEGVEAMTVYPNPMRTRAWVEFDNSDYSEYQLVVTDLKGSVVYTKGKITGKRVEIPRGNLKSGHYLIELRGDKVFRGRLVVE